MEGADLVRDVTCAAAYEWRAEGDEAPEAFLVPPERRARRRLRIAAYDLGIKRNILRRLAAHNCDIQTSTSAFGLFVFSAICGRSTRWYPNGHTTRRRVSLPYRLLPQAIAGASVSVMPCHATATV